MENAIFFACERRGGDIFDKVLVYVLNFVYTCKYKLLKKEDAMKNTMKSILVLIGLALIGVDVYSSRYDDVVERNEESLSAFTAKTGISIVRQENFQITETVTTFDEITTCMSGSSQSCYAGTVHVRVANP